MAGIQDIVDAQITQSEKKDSMKIPPSFLMVGGLAVITLGLVWAIKSQMSERLRVLEQHNESLGKSVYTILEHIERQATGSTRPIPQMQVGQTVGPVPQVPPAPPVAPGGPIPVTLNIPQPPPRPVNPPPMTMEQVEQMIRQETGEEPPEDMERAQREIEIHRQMVEQLNNL